MKNKALAKSLLEELDILVKYWLDYFIQQDENTLDSFDGISKFTSVDIKTLKDALEIIHVTFKNVNHSDLVNKIESVNQNFKILFDIYGEYFDDTPENINNIAYLIHACYQHRYALFIDLNEEKLKFYLQSAIEEKLKL